MAELGSDGSYLHRGGKKIPLDQEDAVFTIVARDHQTVERVRSLPAVHAIDPIQNGVFKVTVDPAERDKTMAALRAGRPGDSGGTADDEPRSRSIRPETPAQPQVICHHAYRPAGGSGTRYYLTDKIVVGVAVASSDSPPSRASGTGEAAPSTQRLAAIFAEEGVRVLKRYPGTTGRYLVQVMRDAGRNPVKVANSLADRPEIAYAEPNLINRFQPAYTPTDTYFGRQWHLSAQDGVDLVAGADVAAPSAWDTTRGSREVVVALIDDGFDLDHPDFQGEGKIVSPKDYVDGDSRPFPESEAGDYHGTPCAGVAIAEENGQGVVGAAPGCAFMPVRFPLTADDDQMWEIFDYVGKRADVISCSWGPPPVYAPLAQIVSEKYTQLAISGGPRKKGCFIVFAAGNNNAPLDDENKDGFTWRHPVYGEITAEEPILNGNAAHPDVVAVAASTSLNRKAAYSNWGREISVCAPSNNFHPLDPTVAVPGLGIWTTDNEQIGAGFTPDSRFTGRFGGTSSATPLVAGVAALVISANPALTARQVKEVMQETADKITDETPDIVLGRRDGTYNDGHSLWFGYGKVNAAAAVARASELRRSELGLTELTLAVPLAGELPEAGAAGLYRLTIGKSLRVALTGPADADFDVYLRRGEPPTTEVYDAVGYSASSSELVSVAPLEPGEYFVLVRSYRGSGAFSLQADLA